MLRSKLKYLFCLSLFLEFYLTGQILYSQTSSLLSATLVGTVTNAITGLPVTGALITVNTASTRSVTGGVFNLNIEPVGTYTVSCNKAGFDPYISAPVIFQQGIVTSMNVRITEAANPSPLMEAVMDTANQRIYLSWEEPAGNYELIYDDGIQEKFTLWTQAGNMNAVKFTPVGYPASVTGCSVHLGKLSDYPPGSNPLVPFQIVIMDAGGPGETPGIILAGPFDVIPTALGWLDFSFPDTANLADGSFFVVMIQGGNAPNAAGIAIDETVPRFRSYNRFVTGNGPWIPASGNFMMRALVSGPGGPVDLPAGTGEITAYQIWRLHQGEESNPQSWTSLGMVNINEAVDPSWPGLPCGAHRWAVQAQYTGNRFSASTFSNVLGKCWTAPVTLVVSLSCELADPEGVSVTLTNLVYPDTVYHAVSDHNGKILFPNVWKGSYELHARKFGYQDSYGSISVNSILSVDIMLLQIKSPPTNLSVDSLSLLAVWEEPFYTIPLFQEDWSSGGFSTGGWVREGGSNWRISNSSGHPSPSALFSWSPAVPNYDQSITSRSITGENSAIMTLQYDINLDNYSVSALDQMAVELFDGNAWHTMKIWNNAGGSIPWTTDELDISTYSNDVFKIRFRSFGEDSYQINGWYVDNILITASESAHQLAPCVFGYNFYLDNTLLAFTGGNSYSIPGQLIKYDSSYQACVLAVYTSGYSGADCDSFTSGFLWPPSSLEAVGYENNVYLSWKKPRIPGDSVITPKGILGYNIFKDGNWLVFLPGQDVLSYYDTGLEPGSYTYAVDAYYDLTGYGFPAQEASSARAGPVSVMIHYGRLLPFFEPWDQGSFSFNDWRFSNGQGNWLISSDEGNPLPSAVFIGLPAQSDYTFALESSAIDATVNNCAQIWLDFDLKLNVKNASGKEKLIIEVYYNETWHQKAEFLNSGNLDWTPCHFDISAVKGKGFRFRVRAAGINSDDIRNWSVDNISVYAVCLPATNFSGEAWGNDIHLFWSPPQCNGGGTILQEGFEESQFPPASWSQITYNNVATWSHTGISPPIGVHTGNFSAGISWDYNHQDEWIMAHNVYVNGNLQFWSMAYQGSAHDDHYYVKVSTDQGNTWETLLDLSQLPPFPGPGGYNQWQAPYIIDMSPYLGDVVDIAWHAVDNGGQGLWYYWGIDDCTMGGKFLEISSDPPLYDIYRQESTGGSFIKANNQPLSDTTYTDPQLPAGLYHYFVRVVNAECSSDIPSDTIAVDVITATGNHYQGQLSVFPNPVSDRIRIKSDLPLRKVFLLNILGVKMAEFNLPAVLDASIAVGIYPAGQYILSVVTTGATKEFLISVVKQ